MRTIDAIARDISARVTGNAATYARPYLQALEHCATTRDYFGADSADMLARYALGNLQTWRGEDARALKAELRAHLEGGQ